MVLIASPALSQKLPQLKLSKDFSWQSLSDFYYVDSDSTDEVVGVTGLTIGTKPISILPIQLKGILLHQFNRGYEIGVRAITIDIDFDKSRQELSKLRQEKLALQKLAEHEMRRQKDAVVSAARKKAQHKQDSLLSVLRADTSALRAYSDSVYKSKKEAIEQCSSVDSNLSVVSSAESDISIDSFVTTDLNASALQEEIVKVENMPQVAEEKFSEVQRQTTDELKEMGSLDKRWFEKGFTEKFHAIQLGTIIPGPDDAIFTGLRLNGVGVNFDIADNFSMETGVGKVMEPVIPDGGSFINRSIFSFRNYAFKDGYTSLKYKSSDSKSVIKFNYIFLPSLKDRDDQTFNRTNRMLASTSYHQSFYKDRHTLQLEVGRSYDGIDDNPRRIDKELRFLFCYQGSLSGHLGAYLQWDQVGINYFSYSDPLSIAGGNSLLSGLTFNSGRWLLSPSYSQYLFTNNENGGLSSTTRNYQLLTGFRVSTGIKINSSLVFLKSETGIVRNTVLQIAVTPEIKCKIRETPLTIKPSLRYRRTGVNIENISRFTDEYSSVLSIAYEPGKLVFISGVECRAAKRSDQVFLGQQGISISSRYSMQKFSVQVTEMLSRLNQFSDWSLTSSLMINYSISKNSNIGIQYNTRQVLNAESNAANRLQLNLIIKSN